MYALHIGTKYFEMALEGCKAGLLPLLHGVGDCCYSKVRRLRFIHAFLSCRVQRTAKTNEFES